MIVYRRRENPGRVEFVHFFWAVGRNRAKKVSGMVGVKNLMSSHGLPYPQCCCRQAGTSPEQHHMLPVCSCNFCKQS